jgi:hypothetical protein
MRLKSLMLWRICRSQRSFALGLYSIGLLLGLFSLAATPQFKPISSDKSPGDAGQTGPSKRAYSRPTPANSSPSSAQWSIMPSPDAGFAPGFLSAVTCVTASDCWAVGRSDIGQTHTDTTLMKWDGASWNLVLSPSVGAKTNGLVAISCLSSSACWAVGYTIDINTVEVKTLILQWNGITWQIVPSPNVGTGFNALYGISCSSETNCWAVGFQNNGTYAQTLIERWDGSSWTVYNSPNPGTQSNVLNGITCVADSDCWAVGYSGIAGAKSSLVVQWDGTNWTASVLPSQPLAEENVLYGVTCNSSSDCWAVGDSYNGTAHQTLIEQWNGTSWANTAAPLGGVDNYLYQVSCDSASDCWAVGNSTNAAIDPQAIDQDLILHWDGAAWSLNAPPLDEATTYANDLTGIACTSASGCWAVGEIQPGGSNTSPRSLILSWDGTSWKSAIAPDVQSSASNYLDGVTCTSSSDCWAVGFDFYGTIVRSLTIHWDGAGWSIEDSPNTATDRSNYLSEVTCVSDSDCWAVGQSSDTLDRERQALAMHWNGTSWSVNNPSSIDTSQALETDMESISCNSTSDCWTVGFATVTQTPRYVPWIEHWNGQTWTSFPAPADQYGQTADHILYHVTCNSNSDCWAVGTQGSVPNQTLINHWDGTSWSEVTSPNVSSDFDNDLYGVTCAASNDCWAVGEANQASDNQILILHWDGTAWSIANAPMSSSSLINVTCSSSTDCWAAGQRYGPTLLVHWDGTSWSIANSPNGNSNGISGVTCPASNDCWAVGQYSGSSIQRTLVLHYAPSVVLTSAVSEMTHGSAGPFDIDLTSGNGIECRSSASLGAGNYLVIFTFGNNLAIVGEASVTGGTGTVSSSAIGPNPNQCSVTLTGVSNAQSITVGLSNVADSVGNFSSAISASMGVLIGDVSENGLVDGNDVSAVQSQTRQPVTSANFRDDVNANGVIDGNDVSLTQAQTRTSLPQ